MATDPFSNLTPEQRAEMTAAAAETRRNATSARRRLAKTVLPVLLSTETGQKYPALARNATRSVLAAVALQCIECMGGNRNDARQCVTKTCSLWLWGPAGRIAAGETEEEAEG